MEVSGDDECKFVEDLVLGACRVLREYAMIGNVLHTTGCHSASSRRLKICSIAVSSRHFCSVCLVTSCRDRIGVED